MPELRPRVAGIPIDPVSSADVLELVRRHVRERRTLRIVTVNAEYVVLARRDERFAEVIESAGLATPDSAGVVWALRRQGMEASYRVGGSDLIWSLSLQAEEYGQSLFLLGGRPGVAEMAANRLRRAYPRLRIAGTYAGSPSAAEEDCIVDLIRRSRADILFVAFGAPQQDLWIARNLARTGVVCALGVGGSLDYVAGTAQRAPVWMRESGLDWAWRLVRQPWRWRRMLALPRFLWLVLTEERRAARTGRKER